jgi:flagellar hook-basal body complex protein FliE
MQIEPITALPEQFASTLPAAPSTSFETALGSATAALSDAIAHADALAASVASGTTSVADASIARAKADVMLEIAAVAASRVSTSISTLLQTQV